MEEANQPGTHLCINKGTLKLVLCATIRCSHFGAALDVMLEP